MSIFQAIILSLVEGITEFLPISSTGHLVLASKLLGITQTEFVKSFEIAIQLGAILAIVFLYFQVFLGKFGTLKKIVTAFIPTGILGLIFYKIVKQFLLGNLNVVILSLIFGGVAMILLENYFERKNNTKNIDKLSLFDLLVVGFVQSVSMIPGVSRAMATIFAGMGVGMNRKSATEFSFLLAVPTMLAATSFDLIKVGATFSSQEFILLGVGFVGAFISAMLTVKLLINYVKSHTFKAFAVYRIILAAIFWVIFR
ncbi:undecaprenyl-diphosphate phosphatase [Patescibacteria group bacterium]